MKDRDFIFTAEHEEPCCGWCDFQSSCDGKVGCGPSCGWNMYRRTGGHTDYDKELIKQIEKYTNKK